MEFYDDIDQDMSIKEYTTVKCKFLKIDDNLVIKGTPCKISHIKYRQKTRGLPIAIITGVSYLNEAQFQDTFDLEQELTVPIPHRSEYLLVAIDAEDYLTLMDISGNTRSDIKLKRQENKQQQKYNDLIIEGYKKKKDVMILIVSIMGHEKIAYCKLLDSQSNPKSSIY